MLFQGPEGINPIDQMKVVGQPTTRIEGHLKTTGSAGYAYERHDVVDGQVYGYPVGAGIPKGDIVSIDTAETEAAPGVITVVTTLEFGHLRQHRSNFARIFGGPHIQHYGQAVVLIVAETFEQARAAAAFLKIEYREAQGEYDLQSLFDQTVGAQIEPVSASGDFGAAFDAAPVKIDQVYRTPDQSHAMMEPHASIASWNGNQLTVWTSSQMVSGHRTYLAETLSIPPENIRIDSPFIGGGFGSKLYLRSDAVLASIAARKANRPVKVAMPRPYVFNNTTHRASTIQRIRIAAESNGRITAIAHENTSGNTGGGRGENSIIQTREMYAGANRLMVNNFVHLDLPEAGAMRAPGEGGGLMALEIAMDEMAEALGMDPVHFRIVNDTQVSPENPDMPFTDRHLIECLEVGAERFGWSGRNTVPGGLRNGQWLIGHGVAAGYRGNPVIPSGARVKLMPDGHVVVETDMTDIGTGSYTIIAQTAAEMMGLTIDDIGVRLGDSRHPTSVGSGGQWGANGSTSGVYAACVLLRRMVAEKLGVDPETAHFSDGMVRDGQTEIPLANAAANGELVAEDVIEFNESRRAQLHATFAAHFIEVGVHTATGEIRVRRMVSTVDSGRILNPITARSQVIGGMVMGVGAALMEELVVDRSRGFFVNHDLAGYEVPVHADIPDQDVIFVGAVHEGDEHSSPMKVKGIGEIGMCGVAAAVANAVHNATGIRVRSYPITLDKFLTELPSI